MAKWSVWLRYSLLLALPMLVPPFALAAGVANGQVTYLVPFDINGQEVFVVRLASMNNKPACNTANRFVMSASNPKFKTYLAIILGASFSNTPIFIHGTGSCTIYDGASEDLAYVCVGPDPC